MLPIQHSDNLAILTKGPSVITVQPWYNRVSCFKCTMQLITWWTVKKRITRALCKQNSNITLEPAKTCHWKIISGDSSPEKTGGPGGGGSRCFLSMLIPQFSHKFSTPSLQFITPAFLLYSNSVFSVKISWHTFAKCKFRPVDTGGGRGVLPPIIRQTCLWRCYKRGLIWQQFWQQFILAIHAPPHSSSAVYGPV